MECKGNLHFSNFNFDILNPPFHLWYLLSLFCWKLFLPLFRIIKHYLLVSIVIFIIGRVKPADQRCFFLITNLIPVPLLFAGNAVFIIDVVFNSLKKHLIPFGIVVVAAIAYVAAKYNVLHPEYVFMESSVSTDRFGRFNRYGFPAGIDAGYLIDRVCCIGINTGKKSIFHIGRIAYTTGLCFAWIYPTLFRPALDYGNVGLLPNIIILFFPLVLILVLSLPVVNKLYKSAMEL